VHKITNHLLYSGGFKNLRYGLLWNQRALKLTQTKGFCRLSFEQNLKKAGC
jgi:hypothetical protein